MLAFITIQSLDPIFKTVARTYGWANPKLLSLMYLDDLDFEGLFYWYEDAKEMHEKSKEKKDKKK